MSLIVIGMSFSKHPVTFEMLSGENVTASSSTPEMGVGFPTPQCSCLMVSTPRPPGGPVNPACSQIAETLAGQLIVW